MNLVNSSSASTLADSFNFAVVWTKSSTKAISGETIGAGTVQSYTATASGDYLAIVTGTGWYRSIGLKINDVLQYPTQISTPYNGTTATVTASKNTYNIHLDSGDVLKFYTVTMGHTAGTDYTTTSTISLIKVTPK